MFNTILNYSRLALVGVATILFVTPLHTLPNNGSPYKYPDGDQDGDRIINKDDICPFSHYSNSKHKWELEKHGVVAINYDQLIEFISDGIDWDAEFHRHDSWIDNTGGQIGNVASVIYMVVLQAERTVVNAAGLFGKKPPYDLEKAQIKTIRDLSNFITKTEDFADRLFWLSRTADLDFRINAKYDKKETGKLKKPTLVLLAASLLYEAAATRYAEAADSSKLAYKHLTSKGYRDRDVKSDPIEEGE